MSSSLLALKHAFSHVAPHEQDGLGSSDVPVGCWRCANRRLGHCWSRGGSEPTVAVSWRASLRVHDLWRIENVEDFSLLSGGLGAVGNPDQSRSNRLVAADRTACGGFGSPRPRLRACALAECISVPYASGGDCRLTAANPLSRKPLARSGSSSLVRRASLKPSHHGAPRWTHSR